MFSTKALKQETLVEQTLLFNAIDVNNMDTPRTIVCDLLDVSSAVKGTKPPSALKKAQTPLLRAPCTLTTILLVIKGVKSINKYNQDGKSLMQQVTH